MTLCNAQDTHLTDMELHLPDMSLYQACLLLPGEKKSCFRSGCVPTALPPPQDQGTGLSFQRGSHQASVSLLVT